MGQKSSIFLRLTKKKLGTIVGADLY